MAVASVVALVSIVSMGSRLSAGGATLCCHPPRSIAHYRLMTAVPPKVFISYSHDSEDHAARVLKLANDLRRDGVDAIIDQYLTSPPQGWPTWMDAHIRDDDFVVMVCSDTYYRRVMRKEKPDVGHGVAWEGNLIYNNIYRDKCNLSRFVPVLLNGGNPDHIPDPLAGATHYLVETPHGYKGLLRQIFKRSEAQMPDIGKPPALPQRTAQWTTRPPAATPASEETKWTIVIEANPEDIYHLIPIIADKLRELSGDATLSVKRISPGSVKLELECSNKAGLRLYSLLANGKLVGILGYKVRSIGITPLIAALHDPDESIREEAAEVLGKLGDTRAIEPLIAALKNDDAGIRRAAEDALGNIGDAQALQPLIEALKDDDAGVRWAAADALGHLGTPAVPPLIEALKDDNWEIRWASADALGKIGTPALQPLIEALKDDDKDARSGAAGALGKIGDARAVPPLIEALTDHDKDVRRAAAEALGKIGDARAVLPLIAILKDDDQDVRWATANALGKIGAPAVPPLIAALKDDKWEVRWEVAEALGIIGAPAVPPLIAALKDDKAFVRWVAAEVLGNIGDTRAVPPLIAALKDDSAIVRRAADQALRNLGSGPPSLTPAVT